MRTNHPKTHFDIKTVVDERSGDKGMKTLIFNGSPRKNGDTVSLIRYFTEQLSGEYKIIDAYRCDISPCLDCRYCWKKSGCAIKDEMQEVYEYLTDCDNVLIASPVYFSELTGPMLSVGSRLQTYFCGRHFRKEDSLLTPKKGAVVLVGGGDGKPDKAYGTAKTLLKFMNCKEIHALVCSHNTENVPAIEDAQAVAGVKKIVEFFQNRA